MTDRPLYDIVADAIVQSHEGPFSKPSPLSYYEATAAIEAIREGASERLKLALEGIDFIYVGDGEADGVDSMWSNY